MTSPQSRSRRAPWRGTAVFLAPWLALAACGGVAGEATKAPAREQPAQRRPAPQRPDPERFRLGLPQDETAFDYDVADQHDDPAPTLDGIPPVTRAVARALQPYLEVRRARLVGVAPGAKRMLVLTRTSETTQVHEVDGPLGMRRQVTFGPEPVEQVAYLPGGTRALSYRRDAGGDENHQIFLLDLETRGTRRLSDGKSRHGPFRWSSTEQLAFTSTARSGRDTELHSYDLRSGTSQVIAELDGRWVVLGWSSDAKRLLMQESRFADESTVHVVEVDTGEMTAIAPLVANTSIRRAWFAKRPGFVYVLSDRDRDFAGVFEVDLATLQWRLITPDRPWDVEEAATSSDGRRLVFSLNEHGYSKVYLKDLMTGRQRRLALPEGVVSGLRFVDRDRKLAFTATTPTEPEDVYLFDLGTGALRRWTESELGGLPRGGFVVPELVQARSFDGLEIPALLYRPPGDGPFPVLFWMHGGPEGQARPAFDPIIQYFASARGIAVLAPNVRGSSGYGKRFMGLDDGLRRHDAVADVGALLDYVDGREDLDSSRVGIHGASYGGFMVLASLVAYPKRFVAGSDVVGMSDLVSFLESTGAYRRGVRRGEYGDERDPKVREYLASISPLTHVKRIRSALLVAHGENDPRVALSEAEQIVSAVRKNGAEAWFFVGRSEGHSFRRRRTRDTFYRVMAEFFERHLLQRTALGLETEKP